MMDGTRNGKNSNEDPIEKPDLPLPMIFTPTLRSELPTKRQAEGMKNLERAHFYLKDFDKNGRPTYGFFITNEPVDRQNQGTSN